MNARRLTKSRKATQESAVSTGRCIQFFFLAAASKPGERMPCGHRRSAGPAAARATGGEEGCETVTTRRQCLAAWFVSDPASTYSLSFRRGAQSAAPVRREASQFLDLWQTSRDTARKGHHLSGWRHLNSWIFGRLPVTRRARGSACPAGGI
jgi:hypothetical protein